MADDEQRLLTEYFPVAAIPRMALAPPGTLGHEAWRDALNVAPYNGVLRRRPAVVSNANTGPTYSLTSAQEQELPLILMQYSAPAFNLSVPSTDYVVCVLITSRRVWVLNHGSGAAVWYDCTPKYTTGTVTATNGSTAVSGAGTLWLTRLITAGQHITIDGTVYKISAVTGDTTLTLSSNFTGVTGGGKAYSILRNWDTCATGNFSESSNIFSTIYNGDLYIAGTSIGAAVAGYSAVIKVNDIAVASPTATYLTGNQAYLAGLDVITPFLFISGIKCLQDGRVVVTADGNYVYYSSHLNTAVWTVTPGGNTPISFFSGPIQAMGQIGPTLTIHHEQGIVLADPTGQADPPLGFRLSSATEGCFAPRTLISVGAEEFFVASTGLAARFDGSSSMLLGADLQWDFLRSVSKPGLHLLFAGYEPARKEYQVFQPQASAYLTDFYTLRLGDGSWWPNRVEGKITAASNGVNPFSSFDSGIQLLGAASLNMSGSERNLLYTFSDADLTDFVSGETTAQGGFYVTTDDLDFGLPMTIKMLKRVVVWFRAEKLVADESPIQAQAMEVHASIDGGETWVTKSLNVTATIKETPKAFWFHGDIAGSDVVRVKVVTTAGTVFVLAITRLLVEAFQGGDIGQLGMI